MQTRKRRWIANLVLSGGTLVIILLLLEVVVRVVWHDEVDTRALREQQETIELQQIARPSQDADLYYELQPNLDTSFRGHRIATSAEGYRIDPGAGSPREAESQEPDLRIALIGDSTPFGLGVEYIETYGELYRKSMEALTGLSIALRNYSVPGYNALQELRIFETRVEGSGVDLVILHHDHNDSEPAVLSLPPGYLDPEYGNNLLHSAAIKWLARRLRLAGFELAKKLDRDEHRFIAGYISSGPLFEAHLEARRELAQRAKHVGIPTVAVLFYCCAEQQDNYLQTPLYRELHLGLGTKLEDMGYEVLDLMPRYQNLLASRGWSDMSALWISEADRHPNAEGHELIAEQLVAFSLESPEVARIFGLEP